MSDHGGAFEIRWKSQSDLYRCMRKSTLGEEEVKGARFSEGSVPGTQEEI